MDHSSMQFNVITLFPELIRDALKVGVVGQAVTRGEILVNTVNPRAFTQDLHQTVDDRPFGGGDGMVMQFSPLQKAISSLGESAGHRVLLSAHGERWSDRKARAWAEKKQPLTLVCGRYGGVDQRFINENIDEEISIGDYILSGGELAALVIVDSVSRLLPQVLGNAVSAEAESFAEDGLLEAPLFTRPQAIGDLKVPAIFMSGDHAKIQAARRLLSLLTTLEKRPDLFTEAHHLELEKSSRLLGLFTAEELRACGLSGDLHGRQ
jgi:tRNA (guanine37-N1)-methyltransferase